MTDKELLLQLNSLKEIKPDSAWKTRSREILLSQISGGDYMPLPAKPAGFSLEYYFKTFFHQPALVASTIMLVVLSGGIFSVSASHNTKPGDSLYIAKIISEKTRSAITFDDGAKAKLGLEFAGNRAKEIAQVLAEPENGDKEAKVEKLSQNFKREMGVAKENLKKINGIENNSEENMEIFSANLGKDDKGMQIYDPNRKEEVKIEEVVKTETVASSTASVSVGVEKVLDEAEKLFDEKNYDGTLTKLEEANGIIDNIGGNKTDGVIVDNQGDQATTTAEGEKK
jgi:hypothetical protein